MGAGQRLHRIAIERRTVTGQDDYGHDVVTWSTWTSEYSAIFYGSGREQREAAQESGSQSASFEVLSHTKTRAISVTDRVRYPVTDPDPATWPVWDVQAVNELGFNKGVRITATRAAI
jgi:head-tail adaptor